MDISKIIYFKHCSLPYFCARLQLHLPYSLYLKFHNEHNPSERNYGERRVVHNLFHTEYRSQWVVSTIEVLYIISVSGLKGRPLTVTFSKVMSSTLRRAS